MIRGRLSNLPQAVLRGLDPRHSLVAAIIWLVVALAASFAMAASLWAGRVARDIVVQQHLRRLTLETDQLASDMGQAVSSRLNAISALSALTEAHTAHSAGAVDPASASTGPSQSAELFKHLLSAYPHLGWIALADSQGRVIATSGGVLTPGSLGAGGMVAAKPWFVAGLRRAWVGSIEEAKDSARAPLLGDFSAPLKDLTGRVIGVVAAHLNWHWASHDVDRLSDALDPRGSAQTLVLDPTGVVAVGPQALINRPWSGAIMADSAPVEKSRTARPGLPRFERLPDGRTVLVARAPVAVDGSGSGFDRSEGAHPAYAWQVQLSEPKENVYQRANALAIRILWISIILATATALLGALGARHLTNRLKRLTRSAVAVGRNETSRIEVPTGSDEVAQLGAAFAKVLDDLHQERTELLALSSDLERRVAVRTREVERLAEESRYAAIVRERLKIARDLHDTLAHSMMAMLSEVRLLRKLQLHDPASLADELARAEEVAHAGLNEARSAITQMRVNAVRDTGLGAALSKALERFKDHTGLQVAWSADAEAARFGDERAETIFRMAEEALRNIERHSRASSVRVTLRSLGGTHLELEIRDDGVGFDPGALLPGHFGLVGLREQAQLIGAELHIHSQPDCGTTLKISLRIAPEIL